MKAAQAWFTGTDESSTNQSTSTSTSASSSLLADWNSYAATQNQDHQSSSDFSSSLGFDIESAVRSANDTVSGTFSVYAIFILHFNYLIDLSFCLTLTDA